MDFYGKEYVQKTTEIRLKKLKYDRKRLKYDRNNWNATENDWNTIENNWNATEKTEMFHREVIVAGHVFAGSVNFGDVTLRIKTLNHGVGISLPYKQHFTTVVRLYSPRVFFATIYHTILVKISVEICQFTEN